MEPIFRQDVHKETNGYSLTQSKQIIFNFYVSGIDYSRKVGNTWSRTNFSHLFSLYNSMPRHFENTRLFRI